MAKTEKELVKEHLRIVDNIFKRFVSDLEATTGRKFMIDLRQRKWDVSLPVGSSYSIVAIPLPSRRLTHQIDYDMKIREHLGILKNPKKLSLKLNNLGKQYLNLEAKLYDGSLIQPVQQLLKQYQGLIQSEFKTPTKINLYKKF